MKPLQWRLSQACQDVEFKFESMFEPLLVIWPSLPNAVLVGNRLRNHGRRWPSSWGSIPAQLWWVRQSVLEYAAVAVGRDWLDLENSAATLVILTQFETQKVYFFVNFGLQLQKSFIM